MYLTTLSEGSRICMQRQLTFGGGVSPESTRLRGQSIIEYVLIIAVIGLVIVFAGPGVAGAIRNQFNLVGNTVNSGTSGGTEGGGASGGGDTGTASATVQAAIAKDAKDWTLGEQKAVAEDIAAKGEASPAYAKAKAAMDAGTKFSVKLTDGKTLTYRIIAINHDDLADGSGKAGLTFEINEPLTGKAPSMDDDRLTNEGGWEASPYRPYMNSGKFWNLLPKELADRMEPVLKMTDNGGGRKEESVPRPKPNVGSADPVPGMDGRGPSSPTATTDKVFMISSTEVLGDVDHDGYQYEYYASRGVTSQNPDAADIYPCLTRSIDPNTSDQFRYITSGGGLSHLDVGIPLLNLRELSVCFCF